VSPAEAVSSADLGGSSNYSNENFEDWSGARFVFVLGSALLLLRSAKIPKIPDHVKAKPYQDEDDDGW